MHIDPPLDILNIVTVAIFGVNHRFDDGFTYGEAYWMTICSTVVSLITNVTLIWDFVRTPNFAQSGPSFPFRFRFHCHVLRHPKVVALRAGNVLSSSSR